MPRARTAAILAATLTGLAAPPAVAQDAGGVPPCSEKQPATLTLDEGRTDPAIAFGRQTGTRSFTLAYRVRGCTLPRGELAGARIAVDGVRSAASDLELSQLRLVSTRVVGTRLTARVSATTASILPGTHGGAIVLDAPTLADNSIPVTITRSESNALKPISLGALGGLAGILWALLARGAVRDKVETKPWSLYVFAGLASAAVGAVAAYGIYTDQEVWTGDNAKATLAVAFAASSTGAAGVILAALGRAPATPQAERPPDPPAASSSAVSTKA